MDQKPNILPSEGHPAVVVGILKRAGTIVIFLVLIAVILFVSAGRLNWTWAWVFLGINIASLLITGPIALRTSPETVAERGELKITHKWDKVISGLYMIAMYIALPLVPGLDLRFGWTQELDLGWHVAGALLLAVGLGLTGWAMVTNAYFSTAARIQSDRGQMVCSSGPYQFVRHPGYTGYILQALGVPILLGSLWGLIPGGAAMLCMIIRASLEDRMLQAELPGYQDYAQRVHYRLVPLIW
jgi:protein-S-isoprenylcysteine O-methyltransferase Ste14